MDELPFLLILIGCAVNCGALLWFKVQSWGDGRAQEPGPQVPRDPHAEPAAPAAEADQFWAVLLDGDAAR
ncbi:MAG: hypothetical protein ACYCO9_15220 [Streptosporangiaceae bacterium]